MTALLPAAVYGLDVPPGDGLIPAIADFPAAFRITMAAIDPSADPELTEKVSIPRATLKLIRRPINPGDDEEEDEDDDDDDDDDDDSLQALLNGDMDDEDDESESDEEANGGPSDPSKTKKARQEAAVRALKETMEDSEDGKKLTNGVNGASNKGKGKAVALDDSDEEDSNDEDLLEPELEEFVLCTLDPNQHYQQPLDITVGEDERVFFKVSGTHTIYLTGNYVVPVDDRPRGMLEDDDDDAHDEDPDEYDLSPDEDELYADYESDDLDDIEDPRVTELSDEENEVPGLVEGVAKGKGQNKRVASQSDEGEPATLDSIMEKSLKAEHTGNGDVKLTKKQSKKLKNNAGQPVAVATETESKVVKKEESPGVKKVQFAKNLEQGPTGKSEPSKSQLNEKKSENQKKQVNEKKGDKKEDGKNNAETPAKPTLGVKTVEGVKIDDKKLGHGPAAKKGSTVSLRYIGKLADNKVFDANKKGKPFSFKIGAGDVIKGWEIGLEGITAGGERRIVVPARLGYGTKAMAGIPPNSQLTFDVKCLEVN